MLRIISHPYRESQLYRLAGIVGFSVMTAVAARVVIPLEPVPFTLQPLAVVLAGMVLGWRDGMLSQTLYLGLIALGLPLDAKGIGSAALVGPTAGFLIGFIAAAGTSGWLVERASGRLWQRWLAGVVGMACIYGCGVLMLKAITGMEWAQTWSVGVAPFIVPDMVKALIAAGLSGSSRRLLRGRG